MPVTAPFRGQWRYHRAMRVAVLGTRGIPGRYGGFETFAEQLSVRLVDRGHRVTVYCRGGETWRPATYSGVELVRLPAIKHKHAETLSHTMLSAVHAALRRYDIVYVCNSANAPICFVPWLRRQKTILNVDGLEWQRAKWGRLARGYYRWAARLAARMPIEIVTDAEVIRRYYQDELKRATTCIPYGTDLFDRGYRADLLGAMSLTPDGYILYVSRLERENNAKLVVEAYGDVETSLPLVIVGDAPYAREYIDEVKGAADGRVRFLGYRFGEDYHALQANARIYIQATEVGGTHPALVEALGHRNAVLAHDVPEHREVMGEAGVYFGYRSRASLAGHMRDLIVDGEAVRRLQHLAERRVRKLYTWDAITDMYETYFQGLIDAQ